MTAVAATVPNGVPVLRDGIQTIMRRVFGARRPSPPGDHDPGLCGPGSPSWTIIAEPAAIAGGVRALLLQTLHPLAMAGIASHSRYREDPLARLQSTSRWVTTSTFGTTAEVLGAAQAVRRAHRVVRGTAPDGRPYRAGDPALLGWVSMALTSSFLTADRLWSPDPVGSDAADRFVAEQSRMAALLDERVPLAPLLRAPDAADLLRAGDVDLPLLDELPRTVAELTTALDDIAPELAVGVQARDAVRFLRWPPLAPALRAAYLPLFAGAAGSLPGVHRRMLHLSAGRLAARVAVANAGNLLGVLRSAVGRSPAYTFATARVTTAA
ncbi:MAG TPA: oxygenase MpaB family protein [Euzebyales bacterium]|nr:oxygenase MpaB family protein [Euzebyales bacterium]